MSPFRTIALAALCLGAGLALGALARPWLDGPGPDVASLDRRKVVESRSTQADFLEALGYVDGTVDPDSGKNGVLRHDPDRAWPGLNFYYSRTQKQAQLVDMDGHAVYSWARETLEPWQHVELDPEDGSIIVLMKDVGLVKLDRDSKVRWTYDGRVHHDLWVDGDGRIFVLARRPRQLPSMNTRYDVLEDVVIELSADGEELSEWSVLEVLEDSPFRFLLPELSDVVAKRGDGVDLDVLHTNHIEVFDGRLAARSPIYEAGNILLSMRNINTILVLDGRTHQVVWTWGPTNLTFQHHPTLLDSGHLLLFNNGTERSEILEIDPLHYRVAWRYGGRADFFSRTRGSNQRLPNGNTLITESDTGYVFEVARGDGAVVWEFANPDVDSRGLRGAIWRMTRYDPADLAFLAGGAAKQNR